MNRVTAFAASSLLRRAATTAAGCASSEAALAAQSSAKKLSATSSINASWRPPSPCPARGAFSSLSGPSFAASRSVAVAMKRCSQSRAFVAAALATAARLRGTGRQSRNVDNDEDEELVAVDSRDLVARSSRLLAAPPPAPPALLGPEAGIACGLSLESSRALSKWLAFCAAWTFSMVVLGGVTRLTRSGLSMTSWSFAGERPPMSESGWEQEFEEYKRHPVSLVVVVVGGGGVLRERAEREREREEEGEKNKKTKKQKLTFFLLSKIKTPPTNPQPPHHPPKPGIQARQPQHDFGGIQVDLLDGMGAPHVGTLPGFGFRAPGLLLFVCEKDRHAAFR